MRGSKKRTMGQARSLRKRMSTAEDIVWDWMRHRRFLNLKFRRQHPVGRYILDFYCDDLKLAVEIDGGIHGYYQRILRDQARETYLQNRGIRVIRVNRDAVECDPMHSYVTLSRAINTLKGWS